MVANSFLAAGGDNFATLAEGTDRADSGRVDLQSMVDYFEEHPVATPTYEQRSVGVHLSAADADGYSAGDELTLDLSSLVFSRGGLEPGTVEVLAGETVLGSAPIDSTIVDTTDEQGRATVTVTIPEGTPAGTLVLTVSVPETGTAIDVPIVVTSSLEAIESLKDPRITGAVRVGKTVGVNEGRWSERGVEYSYQWNSDGEPIQGATGDRYKLTKDEAGTELTVTVTASKDGFSDGVATSEARVVKEKAGGVRGIFEDLLDELFDLIGWLFG